MQNNFEIYRSKNHTFFTECIKELLFQDISCNSLRTTIICYKHGFNEVQAQTISKLLLNSIYECKEQFLEMISEERDIYQNMDDIVGTKHEALIILLTYLKYWSKNNGNHYVFIVFKHRTELIKAFQDNESISTQEIDDIVKNSKIKNNR